MSDDPRIPSLILPPTAVPAASPAPANTLQPWTQLSADAILAAELIQPCDSYVPSSSSSSTSNFPRPAHSSRKRNASFGAINTSTLRPVSQNQLDRFKNFVRSIPILFPSTLVPRFRGWSVTTKGDVVHFLDSQVLDIAWQVVLEMAPSERDWDFTATKQLAIESSVPDQLFGLEFTTANGTNRFQPSAVAEIKAPGYVTGLASVLTNALTMRTDTTDDWVAITSQLRKYSIQTCCRDILIMDERTAIYFQFGDDAMDVEEDIEYLVGSAAHQTTMRQLVAFACWRGLKRKVKLATFHTGQASMAASIVSYDPVLDNTPRAKRSPDAPDESQSKRPRRHGGGNCASGIAGSRRHFAGWQAVYVFQMAVVPFAAYQTAPSTDSGDVGSSPPHGDRPPKRDFEPPEETSWSVVDVISTNVALLECAGHQYVGKWFGVRSDRGGISHSGRKEESEVYFDNEVAVYSHCHTLQGCEIPHCYGVGDISGINGVVLVVEYVPGPGVGDVLLAFRESEIDSDEAVTWLHTLKGSATDAVKALHRFNVVHLDLHGWNMVVLNDSVVLLDFDVSMLYTDGKGLREWEDWVCLEAAFAV